MEDNVVHEGAHDAEHPHHKPKHIAEKMESYVGVIMAVVALVLLVVAIYAITQTGSATPSWMRPGP